MRDKSNIEDMIKALKCVASQIPSGDCHADIENFKHRDDADFKSVVCTDSEKPRGLTYGSEGQCCPYYQKTYGCCFEDGELYWLDDVAKLLEELKEYRNLSKQGRLLRLPCKKGDIVWELCKCDDGVFRIFPMEVKVVIPYGELRYTSRSYSMWNIYAESDYTKMYKSFYDIGTSVFLTKEEAEAKLKELEESHD